MKVWKISHGFGSDIISGSGEIPTGLIGENATIEWAYEFEKEEIDALFKNEYFLSKLAQHVKGYSC